MATLLRQKDWSTSPLGPPDGWPQALRTAIRLILNTGHPMYIWWGQDLLCFYNDAYSRSIGPERHPSSLGQAGREVWAEIWPIIGPQVDQVMAGRGATWQEDALVPITRNGQLEDVYWTYSYSPIDDETAAAGIGGVLVVCSETTANVVSLRATAHERERQQQLLNQMPGFAGVLSGPDHVYTYVNRAYVAISGKRDFVGRPVREVFPELAGQGFFELLDGVYTTGERFSARSVPIQFAGEDDNRFIDLLYEPVRDAEGDVVGIFVGGYEVTDRIRGEAALRESEAQLRLATEAGEIGFWDVDVISDTLFWPASVKAMFGISPDVPVSMADFYAGLHPDDRASITAAYAAAADPARRAVYDVEYRTIGKEDGVVRHVAAKGRGLFDDANACIRVLGTAIDVTARKFTERQLRILNETLEAEVENQLAERDRLWTLSRDPLLIADSSGRWLRVSPRWTQILGWSEAELIGRSSEWMEHPDDRQKTRGEIEHLASGATTMRFENRFRDRDGRYHTFSWTAVEESGLLYAVARDITADREKEQQLRDSQDFARLAVSAVGGVGVWTFDIVKNRFYFDAAIAELYALTPEQGIEGVSREGFLVNVIPEDRTALAATMNGGLRRPGDLELEYRIVHPDGSLRWVLSRGTTYFDEAGQPIRRTGVGLDLTEKRQLEEQLRQSQKMEAVGQLTGGIAHDFNNMLAVVMGSLDLLSRRIGAEDPRAKHYVQAASEGAKRAANLTQRLLAFSRQQPLKPEAVNLNRLVGGMSDLLVHSLGGAVQLETVLAAGVWAVHADPNQLENVILNLGVNGRDAMPDGGRLTIETQNTHLDTRYVASEFGVSPGQYVMIAVSDTGCGMAPDVIAKAFDPFFTTKEVGRGTGLGLSQVYGFVKQSGGHIKIYSEPGQGTSVKIYLPRLVSAEARNEADPVEYRLLGGEEQELILVVDDEPMVRRFSVDALTALGYRVLEADGAATALRIIAEQLGIAMVFTDIVMPKANGRKLADAVRRQWPRIKILFTTGYTRNAVVHNGIVDPGVELIGKPYTIDELAAKVREVLDKS